MPISAFLVSKLLNLPSHYAAGLILVGCCPGGGSTNLFIGTCEYNFQASFNDYLVDSMVAGTASNIVTYIARYVNSQKYYYQILYFSDQKI